MGILNVTPDSFSDGGRWLDARRAADHAGEMIAAGADLIDVGGESTRPGAAPVPAAEQIRRTVPVIERILETHPLAFLSIDTQAAAVARAALAAGVRMVNDISALRADPQMAEVVAASGAWVVLMHMRGTPATMQDAPSYQDVVAEVAAFLDERRQHAVQRGIAGQRILVDPGIGFGKTLEQNLQLVAGVRRFTEIAPVLIGTSRKSFIGRLLGIEDPKQRDIGTEATHAVALLGGARVVRVHDVRAARQTIEVIRAILKK
jgi:dihydropteroate synthase